ncbi:hypothetical protein O3M35_005985 [Rhynocoris fuscipes]|uniref:Uncharacterized protein n=1 Tax=Rhynocoris fuscipes TaxID=488301 RepID=A0AAW1DHI7_9HEMI
MCKLMDIVNDIMLKSKLLNKFIAGIEIYLILLDIKDTDEANNARSEQSQKAFTAGTSRNK